MADPKRTLKLVEADEDYVPPTSLDALQPQERATALRNTAVAQAIKEGRRRQRTETERAMGGWAVEQLKAKKLNEDAHAAELDRLKSDHIANLKDAKAHGRWQGLAVGACLAAFLAIVAGYGVWWLQSDLRAQLVAQQRTLEPHETWQPPTTRPMGQFQ